jgi:uncharacterized protein involved in exopolysaccharide biosynthesis
MMQQLEGMSDKGKTDIENVSVSAALGLGMLAIKRLWPFRWKLILLSFLGGVIGFLVASYFREETYTSRLSFTVEEKSGLGVGNLAGIASQFGIDFGGGSNGLFTTDNLMALIRSQNIVQNCLLTKVPEAKNKSMLNIYLENHYADELKSGEIQLIPNDKQKIDFTRKEDSLLLVVIGQVQQVIKVGKADKKSSIIDLRVTDLSEIWSYHMSLLLIEKAKSMYFELKVGKTARTVEVLRARTDSVKLELDKVMTDAALASDQNQSLVLMKARVPAAKKQIQVQILTTMYGELVKNLELMRFTLEREEPVIQIIDSPMLPLVKKGKDRVINAILYAIFFMIFGAGFYLYRQWRIEEKAEIF